MDVQQIVIALQHSFNPNEAQRKEAEQHLARWETMPGYLPALLQIAGTNELAENIRQAAAIQLRNKVKSFRPPKPSEYDDPNAAPPVDYPEGDRSFVKENIVDALVHSPPLVRSQLTATINTLCKWEFPKKWPSLLPKTYSFLTSNNPLYMNAALLALQMAFQKFRYAHLERKRKELDALVKDVFPTLLALLQSLSGHDNLESLALQRLICKIYYSSTYMGVPPYLVEGDVLGKWMSYFASLLEKPVPENIQPADLSERAKFPYWGAKKWAARIVERSVRRYGKPQDDERPTSKQYATAFSSLYSVQIMESLLRVMTVKRGGGGYLPDKFTQTVLAYLRLCLRYGLTYTVLKPHLAVLTQEILFPYLCLSDADKQLWDEDPVEYLRKEFDPLQEFYNPRTEAVNFITDLVTYRGKVPLNKFMTFIVHLLQKYTAAQEDQRNPREKDGCLHAIGSLAVWLKSVPEYKPNLERMLLVHVFPEFNSRVGFLRARACWIFSQFYSVKFTNLDVFYQAVQKVVTMMTDPELPVRVQATLALRWLIMAPKVEDVLRPVLPQVLEAIFKVMHEIESEDLVATLERIIYHFGEEIAPFAVALCQRLSQVFLKFSKDATDEDDLGSSAAIECLTAMRSLLRGVRHMPHIYAQLNPIILPLLVDSLNDRFLECFEYLLQVLTFCTYYGDPKPMWPTFPLIVTAFDLWATYMISDIVPPMDNFISRDTETFLSGPYLDMVLNMYKKLVADKDSDESDTGTAAELIESVLHNCRGRVDRILPEVLSLTVTRLLDTEATQTKELKVFLIAVIANALYYNPPLALQILDQQGTLSSVFTFWFQSIPLFKRQFDLKLVVLGLSAIFELGLTSLPPLLQHGSKQIMETLVALLKKLEELRKEQLKAEAEHEKEKAAEAEKKANGAAATQQQQPATAEGQQQAAKPADDDDDDDEVEILDIPDDQDVDAYDSEDDADFGMLAGDSDSEEEGDEASEAEVEGEDGADDDDEDEDVETDDDDDLDDEDDDGSDSDDETYTTPIDRVDELIYFASKVHSMFATDANNFQSLLSTLKPEDQKEVQHLVELAKTREVENQQQEQKRLLRVQQKAQQRAAGKK